ncbi:hypothetical protein HK102_006966 [Quaeritorhiza haematococci]|nr:hypothetical protein HK102_006966 [Quaeritorhiza haematococci]
MGLYHLPTTAKPDEQEAAAEGAEYLRMYKTKTEDGTVMYDFPPRLDVIFEGTRFTITRFPHNGKRATQGKTFKLINKLYRTDADNTFLLWIDSDVILHENAIPEFARAMKRDPRKIAYTGYITVRTSISYSPLLAYQDIEYFSGQLIERAFEAMLGCVVCLPGALTCIRLSAFKQIAPIYLSRLQTEATIDFHRFYLGEDRYMTHLLMETQLKPYSVGFVPSARCKTEAPDTVQTLLKQRRRWYLGAISNEIFMFLTPQLYPRFPVLMLFLMIQFCWRNISILNYIAAFYYGIAGFKLDLWMAIIVVAPYALRWLYITVIALFIKRSKMSFMFPVFSIVQPFLLMLYSLYAVLHLTTRTWGGPRADQKKDLTNRHVWEKLKVPDFDDPDVQRHSHQPQSPANHLLMPGSPSSSSIANGPGALTPPSSPVGLGGSSYSYTAGSSPANSPPHTPPLSPIAHYRQSSASTMTSLDGSRFGTPDMTDVSVPGSSVDGSVVSSYGSPDHIEIQINDGITPSAPHITIEPPQPVLTREDMIKELESGEYELPYSLKVISFKDLHPDELVTLYVATLDRKSSVRSRVTLNAPTLPRRLTQTSRISNQDETNLPSQQPHGQPQPTQQGTGEPVPVPSLPRLNKRMSRISFQDVIIEESASGSENRDSSDGTEEDESERSDRTGEGSERSSVDVPVHEAMPKRTLSRGGNMNGHLSVPGVGLGPRGNVIKPVSILVRRETTERPSTTTTTTTATMTTTMNATTTAGTTMNATKEEGGREVTSVVEIPNPALVKGQIVEIGNTEEEEATPKRMSFEVNDDKDPGRFTVAPLGLPVAPYAVQGGVEGMEGGEGRRMTVSVPAGLPVFPVPK